MTDLPDAALDALAARHCEVLTTFTDLTGREATLREGCCLACGDRWPCEHRQLIAALRASHAQVAALRAACEAAAEHFENERMVLGHGEDGPCNCHCCTYYEPLVRAALTATAAPPEPPS